MGGTMRLLLEPRRAERLEEQVLRRLVARARPPLTLPVTTLFTRAFGPPDPWQAQALASTADRMLLNVTRQGGKSSVAATLAVHEALTGPDALILLLSPSLRQSQELFQKALAAYRAIAADLPADAESALRLQLTNGARIISLPGQESTIRGYSGVALLIVDEASRVPDDLYYAIRPMLAVSQGRLLALSTPWGQRGWWHQAWMEGGAGWERIQIPAAACPRIPAAFLAEEQRSLPPWVYRQEYECSFEATDQSVFLAADIAAAMDATIRPLWEASA
jgi:hypothetical protein